MVILVTGAAGYIGSHACLELLDQGFDVVAIDNLSNSCEVSLKRVQKITGKSLNFHKVDITNKQALDEVISAYDIQKVIHFAGFKAVAESVEFPLKYYRTNLIGSIVLFELLSRHGIKDIVFSSSCTVYGNPKTSPINEDIEFGPMNPYGRSKTYVENILSDLYNADPSWNVVNLRYFNPIGAHPSGKIGEDPCGIPNNLLPFVAQVAVGKRKELFIFGDDYPTEDGTAVRDYIHILDLIDGHIKALNYLNSKSGLISLNLGTGKGSSVLEVVKTFEKVSMQKIPYRIVDRRAGDAAIIFADPKKANIQLDWYANRNLEKMCTDMWKWQSMNPNGYAYN